MAFDRLGYPLVLIFAVLLSFAPPTLPAQEPFGPRPESDLTELIEDNADHIQIQHRWGLDSDLEKTELAVAIPASGSVHAEIVGVELTSIDPPVEGEAPASLIYEGASSLPIEVQRLYASIFRDQGFIRGNRIGSLTLQPRQINLRGVEGGYRVTGMVIDIDLTSADTTSATPPPDPLTQPALEAFVINDEGLARWRVDNPPAADGQYQTVWHPEPDLGRWLKIETEASGPIRVNFADLPVRSVDPDRIRLIHHGSSVPIWFDPSGEGFIFIAPEEPEPFSPTTAFWLDLASEGPAVQMERLTAEAPTPEEAICDPLLVTVLEEDGPDLFQSLIEPTPRRATEPPLDERRPTWVWQELRLNDPLRIRLPGLAGDPGTRSQRGLVSVDLAMTQGQGGLISHVNVTCGDETAEAPLPAGNAFRVSPHASLPAAAMQQGWITLSAGSRTPNPVESEDHRRVYLDRVTVSRPIARANQGATRHPITLVPSADAIGAVTTLALPRDVVAFQVMGDSVAEVPTTLRRGENQITLRGADWKVVVGGPDSFTTPASISTWEPVDLHSWDRQTDMLIITHHDLRAAAERLAEFHRRQGLNSEVIDIQNVYDWYGGGVLDPNALRAFLIDTLQSWPRPSPAYVTLLGDCSRDYHGDWRTGVANFVPSFIRPNPSAQGVYWQADDQRYTQLAGGDALGDVFLGRLSAADAASAMDIVDKIIAYDETSPMGTWRSRVGFIADNDRISGETFDEMCEDTRLSQMDMGLAASTAYLRDLTWVDNVLLPEEHIEQDPKMQKLSPETTSRIRDLFNSGSAIVTYFGHGGPNIWTDERIWFGCDSPRSDNLRLTNTHRQPFVVNMTCSSGAIDSPDPSYHICISEDFLRVAGGAIGCFVPTGEGIPTQHRRLTRWLMRAIFSDNLRQLGPATTLASWRFIIEGRGSDLVESFVLLGDPSLNLEMPQVVTQRTSTPTTVRAGVGGTLSFDAAPTSLASAEGEIRLIDPSGTIAERRTATWQEGQTPDQQSFPVSPEAEPGRWVLSAHWWNEESRTDELVEAEAWVERGLVSLVGWGVADARSLTENEDVIIEVDLRKISHSGIDPVEVSVVRLGDPTAGETLATRQFELSDRELHRFQIPIRLPAGIHRLALESSVPLDVWTADSQPSLIATHDIAVRSDEASASLAASPIITNVAHDGADANLIRRFDLSVGNIGNAGALPGEIHLMRGTEVRAFTQGFEIPHLMPGEVSSVRVGLNSPVPVTDEVRAVIDWPLSESGDSHGEVRVALPLIVPQPDVAILPTGWRMIPESPSEGETIWVEAEVENRGVVPAPRVDVELRNSNGSVLQNRADAGRVSIPVILPGEREHVRLRWDPRHNAGDNVIRVVADASRQIEESDETNNEIHIDAHVRTPENVRLVRAVRWINPQVDPPAVTLTTQISNFGETDARDYLVTWYRDQERTSVIGETPIPLVRAGATIPVEFRWELSPEDAAAQQRGGSLSPTCDLGLRVGMRRVVPEEPEEP